LQYPSDHRKPGHGVIGHHPVGHGDLVLGVVHHDHELGVPPALSKMPPALPALIPSDRLDPHELQSSIISPGDDDEAEDEIKMAYTKPLNRVIGTSVLFLILGLLFLKGRRDVGSR
jgi:hypothetical protein